MVCGNLLNGDNKKIIGISIARNKLRGIPIIKNYIEKFLVELMDDLKSIKNIIEEQIIFEDQYILNGYGKYNSQIINLIKDVLRSDGIPLDTTYTGKAFWGMTKYLTKNEIQNKRILFVHTGGLPIFFDTLKMVGENK